METEESSISEEYLEASIDCKNVVEGEGCVRAADIIERVPGAEKGSISSLYKGMETAVAVMIAQSKEYNRNG